MGQSRRPHTVYLDPAKGVDIPAQRRELLDKGPVVRVAFPGNLEVWALTHDAPLRNALADESVFVRGWRNWRALMAGEVDPTHPVANMLRVESMLARSGADHKRMRGLVQAAFTRRRVEALRPRIEEITNELLDRMDESDGVVDLKAAYSFPLPIRVISELQTLVTRTLSGTDPEANADAFTFVASLIEAKRKNLDDGLISAMIEARAEDGDRLSETELIHNTLLLIIGGFETTMGMISNSVQLLLTHPDQLHLLRTGQASWENAIEECLRFESAVVMLPFLYTTRDVEIDGITIPAGDAVLIGFGPANRDPQAYDDPDRFDITRPRPRHLAFGHGAHLCLGAALARLELLIALPALFERFPDITLVGEAPPTPTVFMNHPLSRPVLLRPKP